MQFIDFVQLDLKSLVAVLFWTNLISIILMLPFWATAKRDVIFSLVKSYFIAKVCQALTWGLILMRGELPDILTINASNTLFLMGMYFEALTVYGILENRSGSLKKRLLAILCLSVLFLNVAEFFVATPACRIMIMSFGNVALLIHPCLVLWTKKNARPFIRTLAFFTPCLRSPNCREPGPPIPFPT